MQASRICRAAVDTAQIFKRAQNGLFHGKMIQFGNNVPHSKHKTRRNWLPNIQTKHFDSELLGRERMRFKVTTCALKTIKKYGGLDNYLLGVRTKFLGEQGMRVRLLLRNELRRREDEAIFAEAARVPKSLGWTKPARRKRAIEANKMRGTKGMKLLEARIKAEERQKVKSFMPNEAEDDKTQSVEPTLTATARATPEPEPETKAEAAVPPKRKAPVKKRRVMLMPFKPSNRADD